MPQFRLAPPPLGNFGNKALRQQQGLGMKASTVILEGGAPWGFRLAGGKDFHEPVRIAKVNPNSKAYNEGIESGDLVESINGQYTRTLQHDEALNLIRQANNKLVLELARHTSTVRASSVPPLIHINGGSNGLDSTEQQRNNILNNSRLGYQSDSSPSPTPALSYSNIVSPAASRNPSSSKTPSSSSSYPTATSHYGNHFNNNKQKLQQQVSVDDNDSATDSADSQDSIIHVTGPYRGPAAAGYIQQQQQQQQQQEQQLQKQNKMAASTPGAGQHPSASTTVWSPFGIKQVKTYKPVSFNASKSVIGGDQGDSYLSYSPGSIYSSTQQAPPSSYSVPSSPSLASRTNLTMQNNNQDSIFSDSPQQQRAATNNNSNNNATARGAAVNGPSPGVHQFQRQTSAPSAGASYGPPKRPNTAVPFSYGSPSPSSAGWSPQLGRSATPVQAQSWNQGQGRSTPVQGQSWNQGRSTPVQGQSWNQGRSTPVQGQSSSARPNPISGVLSPDANKNKGLNMFLKQQQRHMEPEQIAAGYASGGEGGSRPTTPVVGNSGGGYGSRPTTPVVSSGGGGYSYSVPNSPQVGRATPILTNQRSIPGGAPGGRSTPVQIGRTTPIVPGSRPMSAGKLNTGRTMPLNMPGRDYSVRTPNSTTPSSTPNMTPNLTPLTSPQLPSTSTSGSRNLLGYGGDDGMNTYTSKSPINLAAFMTPIKAKGIGTSATTSHQSSLPWNPSSTTSSTSTDPALPLPPTIAPLTMVPKGSSSPKGSIPKPPPPPPVPGSPQTIGRTTPVFGSSTPIGRANPVVASGPTGTATPFMKDFGLSSSKADDETRSKAFDTPLSITTSSIQFSASSTPSTSASVSPAKQTTSGMWTPDLSTVAQDDEREKERLRERQKEEELRNTPLSPPPEETFAWKPSERSTTTATNTATTTTTTSSASASGLGLSSSPSQWNGAISHFSESKSGMPTTQSATVTLLQRNREGHIPKGAIYMGSDEKTEGDKKHTDTYYLLPGETKTETKTTVKEAPKYAGIGPVDSKTGMPTGFRKHVDEDHQKDWYKQMYSSLHRQDKPKKENGDISKEENPYKPTYVFPEDREESDKEEQNPYRPSYEFPSNGLNGDRSPHQSPSRTKKVSSWSPPDASYRSQVFKVQPRSIEDYEPGLSSIASKEKYIHPIPRKSPNILDSKQKNELHNPPIEKPGDYNRYTDSGRKQDIRKRDRTLSPASDVSTHDLYKQIQSGGDIPVSGLQFPIPRRKDGHGQPQSSSARPNDHHSRSPASTLDRRRRDEEAALRKQEMQRYFEDQRHKKVEKEMRENEARRHNDIYFQKSPITPDRFEEFGGMEASELQRPQKKVKNTVVRGKAKALYTFTAHNPKELSIKRHDVMYLLRDVDRHWYECEHHGRIGIVPKTYIQVMTSLEDARTAAIQRQGLATAKYTFKAQTAVELSMNKGDTVQLVRRVDDHWLEGRKGDKQGIFPSSYVEILREPDTPLANTPAPSSFATTPVPGSPGQLSPGSTISNGPAPTIPSAPISPRTEYSSYSAASTPYHSSSNPYASSPVPQHRGNHSTSSSSLNVLGMSPGASGSLGRNGYGTLGSGATIVSGGSTLGRSTSPYPRDNVKESYTRKYEERINTSKQDSAEEGLYPPYRALYAYQARATDELTLREGDVVYVMERCDDGWFVGTSQRTHEFGTFPGNYVQRC